MGVEDKHLFDKKEVQIESRSDSMNDVRSNGDKEICIEQLCINMKTFKALTRQTRNNTFEI